jgi:maltose/moltooligosaccharide transporter
VPDSRKAPDFLTAGQLFRLSALWLGLQFFWTTQQLAVMPGFAKHFAEIEFGAGHVGWYYGLLKSCGAVVVMAVQLTIGFISDHAHSKMGRRRPFILYGTLSGCLAILFFLFAPGYWWLFLAYMLIEATINVASVPFQSLLPDLVPEKQHSQAGASMGFLHLSGNLLAVLSLAGVAFAFGDDLFAGYRGIFGWLYPAFLVATMLIVVLSVDETGWARHAAVKIEGAFREVAILPGTVVRFAKTAPTLLGSIIADYRKIELRSQSNLMFLWASRFLIYLGYVSFSSWIYFYAHYNLDGEEWLRSLGVAEEKIPGFSSMVFPALLLVFILGGLAGNRASVPLSLRLGKKWVIAAGLVVGGTMLVPLILTHSVWVAMASGLAIGAGFFAFVAADWAFACTLMPKNKAGSYMGIWDVSTLLPQVIAPVIAGRIRDVVFGANLSRLGEAGAWALSNKWVFASILVWFALGLVVLVWVREQRTGMRPANPVCNV